MVYTYRITAAMITAGASAMQQCREIGGHTPQTTCQAIFTAMLNAADIHPGKDIRKSFAWSPHDAVRMDAKGRPRRLPKKQLTRADFDADGVRKLVQPDGSVHYQLISNYWYLREAWEVEKKSRKITTS
jgi:hypothetical protein